MFLGSLVRPFRNRRRQGEPGKVRIALVSTPRSGNTWFRHMIDHAYRFSDHELGELALYNPFEASWSELPGRCVIMTHWPRVEELEALFREHSFQVVTLARHPLDVLLSILQYAPCGGSLRWLEGHEGDEQPIYHRSPQSDEFLSYAVSPRAQALLSVSAQWWNAPGCHRIRYEDLVRNPRRELDRLLRTLGVAPAVDFAEAIEACTFQRLRNEVTARHFWQGKPGLWKSLLPPAEARRMAWVHRDVFSALGYTCRPDRRLDQAAAAHNWTRLTQANGARSAA